MLRLRAFRPTGDKIVRIQLHPTHPWLVTADASDHVAVWNWEHRQVIYELKAGGVDERRLVGAKLEKLAEGEVEPRGKPIEAMRGGSCLLVSFYDDDVRFWQLWRNRAAAAEAPAAVHQHSSAFSLPAPSTRGRHFLVICCENKAIFLDLVTMRGRDVPKQELDNKSLLWQVHVLSGSMENDKINLKKPRPHDSNDVTNMEFLAKSSASDGPLVAFGGSDGVIRVLSMISWKYCFSPQLVRRYTGGHKGSISCLMTFMAASGEALLVSGASDGSLVIWSADHAQESRELVPKLSLKAHDGGVVAVELSRVLGGAPQLITIGADKTLAIWDTISFKELRRIKPVPKLACHSVASWCHPRAPNLDILTCVKDSHIWAIENPTYSALTRPLCELSSLVPPQVLVPNKKLRVYCMIAHPLQPHLVATGTNIGVILSEFDPRSLPAVAPLPTQPGSREHFAVYVVDRELKLLNFQLSNVANPSLGTTGSIPETGKSRGDSLEPLHVKQIRKHISTPLPHDSYSILSVSSSGKYIAVVWPDICYFSIYQVKDWSVVDSGTGRLLAWDTCRDRFALLETVLPPRIPIIHKGGSSRKAKEAAAAAAQAAAAAASAASSATVQVRILLDDGTSHVLTRSIDGRSEPVIGLHGGALLGVAYRTARRISPVAATAISAVQPLSGYGGADDAYSSPEWTAWDQTVEYCAFAYQQYIVISSLCPQYRYLGDVAIPAATGGVWHRRQLFVATPTTIECVFVDAGVAPIDLETKRRKEEMKAKEAQSRAITEHGELALITVDGPQVVANERISLRPPMLQYRVDLAEDYTSPQVVRLASFQHAPSVPPFLSLPKLSRVDGDDSVLTKETEERKASEVAVGGGGVSVAVTRFPTEQKRPVGPLVVVGVRDGVLWLVDSSDRGEPSLVHVCPCVIIKPSWASRLGREHHDDLAQFMLGMGYATEALHLPAFGFLVFDRLEFDLAMKSNDLKRALQCLLTMSNSKDIGNENAGVDVTEILSLAAKQENHADAVQGIVKFAKEFMDLIDAADATGQSDIAREALKRLAATGAVKGALRGQELRGVALRLANHGELTRLGTLVNNLITTGQGREAAFSAAVLGDNALMEKAWQDTGMLAEAVLHAQVCTVIFIYHFRHGIEIEKGKKVPKAHGRPTLKSLVQAWNKTLQKELEHTPSVKTDATAAFLASLEEPKLTSLAEAGKKPPIEILPPGMPSLSAPPITIQKKPNPAAQSSQQQPGKPLLLEAAPSGTPSVSTTQSASGPMQTPDGASVTPVTDSQAPPATVSDAQAPSETDAQAPPIADTRAPREEDSVDATMSNKPTPGDDKLAPATDPLGSPATNPPALPPAAPAAPDEVVH
ncbi:hypothetical protein ACLOJK_010816 [Asimina triloba]